MSDTYYPGSSPADAKKFDVSFPAWMDRLMRTNYSVANLVLDAVDKGDFRPLESLYRGFTGKDKTMFGDVLDELGIQPETTVGKFARGAAGLALDVALDPLTYVGVGALTKTGEAAKMAGKLAPTMGARAAAGQAALLSLKGPFAEAGLPLIRGTPVMQGLTQAGEAAKAIPGVATLGKAFVPGFRPQAPEEFVNAAGVRLTGQAAKAEFATTWARLQEARSVSDSLAKAGTAEAKTFAIGVRQSIDDMVKRGAVTPAVVDDVLDAVERRSFGASLPPPAQEMWKKLTSYADNLAERRGAIGKSLLTETEYNHWLHTLSVEERAAIAKKGYEYPFREFSTKSPSDLRRDILKFVNPDTGAFTVGKAETEGLLPLTFKGMSKEQVGDLFSHHIKDMKTAQDIATRFGIKFTFGPAETVGGKAIGRYTFIDMGKVAMRGEGKQVHRTIRVATKGKSPDQIVETIAHEMGHMLHGVAGEVGTLQFMRGGSAPMDVKMLRELQQAILSERKAFLGQMEGRGEAMMNLLTRVDPKYASYIQEPTEVLARLASLYRDRPEQLRKVAPLTTERFEYWLKHDPRLAQFYQGNLSRAMGTGPLKGYSNLFMDSAGNVLVAQQATIREVNEAFGRKYFETDPARTAAISGMRLARQEAGHAFFTMTEPLGRRVAPGSWVPLSETTQRLWPGMKGLKFDPQIAKEIERTVGVFTQEESTKAFLKTFDQVQGAWKAWTLGPIPAYHFRNFVGNIWNNYLAGVTDPALYNEAAKLQVAAAKGTLNPSQRTLWQMIERYSVAGRGMYATEASFLPEAAKTLTERVTAIPHAAMQAGSHIEDNARITHFLDRLKRGYSPSEAANSVKKYLFDYSELTPFEQNVMRRLFPFYAWSRKNIPLQLEALITSPGKVLPVEKARQELYRESGRPDMELLPQWAKERMPAILPLARRGITYFPIESWLPYADTGKLTRPQDMIGELLTPMVKIPVEMISNRMYYFDRPIEDYPGEMEEFLKTDMPAWLAYLGRQTRVLAIANRLMGGGGESSKGQQDQPDLGMRAIREVTGIKLYQQDLLAARKRKAFEIRKELEKLSIGLARAEKAGRGAEAARIQPKVDALKQEARKWL